MAARTKVAAPGRVRTVRRRVVDLAGATYNPRRISEKARAALAASMDRWGLVQPIVVNRRTPAKGWPPESTETVVGGHQRLGVLAERGVAETDVVLLDLSPVDEKALNVALNSPRLAGEFTAGLGALLQEIRLQAPELHSALLMPGMKASARDLDAAAGASLESIDEAALVKAPVTRSAVGDVWALGPHRLACGDARDLALLDRCLDGALADCVFTDPPYGVSYDAPSGQHDAIAGDELTRDRLVEYLRPVFAACLARAQEAAAWYVWHASATAADFRFALTAAGLEERQQIVWAKPQIVLGRADYQWAHEPCFYASRAGVPPKWYGDRAQPTVWRLEARAGNDQAVALGPGVVVSDGQGHEVAVLGRVPKRKLRALRVAQGQRLFLVADGDGGSVWEVARDAQVPEHPTQKPVALAARALRNSTPPGGHVLDPYAGAGGVLLAAEQLGRVAHLVELKPAYCDVVLARWESLTRKKARRIVAGPKA